MASVLLLLPDEMLEALDECRRGDEPRLVWIRDAINEKIRARNRQTLNPVRIPTSDGGWRFVPQSPATPPHEPLTITRQGTLPDGDVAPTRFATTATSAGYAGTSGDARIRDDPALSKAGGVDVEKLLVAGISFTADHLSTPKKRRNALGWAVGVVLALIIASAGLLANQLIRGSPRDRTADVKTTTTTTAPLAATTGSPGPDPQLVDDAQTVSTDLSTLTTDQGALEQFAESVSSETTAIEQDDDCALSSELLSNARALDGAAQTVQNDYNQLNSDEATYRTLELTEPSRAPQRRRHFSRCWTP